MDFKQTIIFRQNIGCFEDCIKWLSEINQQFEITSHSIVKRGVTYCVSAIYKIK